MATIIKVNNRDGGVEGGREIAELQRAQLIRSGIGEGHCPCQE